MKAKLRSIVRTNAGGQTVYPSLGKQGQVELKDVLVLDKQASDQIQQEDPESTATQRMKYKIKRNIEDYRILEFN